MSDPSEIHLHFHGPVTPAAITAAVRAALRSQPGDAAPVADQDDAEPSAESVRALWARAYTESEEDAAGRARPLLKFLAQNPERLVPYPEVSKALGFTNNRSLPGLLGAFGRRAEHRYGGVRPFERIWANGGWNLRMSAAAASVISGLY